ncbi:hypothetical protein ROZALSC1DRAFT_28184 [Rozella allomycis CSF55]|uniref:Uncharacterized protein n=1 Tax=Rozella allomycis (strain CSF55) TaxID=988480 RepID=A0A075ANS0_ROZAC|nr:hypothetical protein O9G_000038 [Rozella allomycis CSF55]RKP20321.1 hypothetical protein ROZALSC1DRAFT_28184 [Rozella allomycis CSF55]|eukprot:EPZ31562.1 hypothetical protein O9G_000038 [Rozella allomycis CSF55]
MGQTNVLAGKVLWRIQIIVPRRITDLNKVKNEPLYQESHQYMSWVTKVCLNWIFNEDITQFLNFMDILLIMYYKEANKKSLVDLIILTLRKIHKSKKKIVLKFIDYILSLDLSGASDIRDSEFFDWKTASEIFNLQWCSQLLNDIIDSLYNFDGTRDFLELDLMEILKSLKSNTRPPSGVGGRKVLPPIKSSKRPLTASVTI